MTNNQIYDVNFYEILKMKIIMAFDDMCHHCLVDRIYYLAAVMPFRLLLLLSHSQEFAQKNTHIDDMNDEIHKYTMLTSLTKINVENCTNAVNNIMLLFSNSYNVIDGIMT